MNILAVAATIAALAASSAAWAQEVPAAAAPAAPLGAEAGATLTLTFSGITTQEGAIMVALYNSEEAFDRGGAPIRVAMAPANAASLTLRIDGLTPGRYAIKSFHDIDGNQQMSTNPMGMPIEPFAFSNNARGSMGPAPWVAAAFDVNGATSHSITIP